MIWNVMGFHWFSVGQLLLFTWRKHNKTLCHLCNVIVQYMILFQMCIYDYLYVHTSMRLNAWLPGFPGWPPGFAGLQGSWILEFVACYWQRHHSGIGLRAIWWTWTNEKQSPPHKWWQYLERGSKHIQNKVMKMKTNTTQHVWHFMRVPYWESWVFPLTFSLTRICASSAPRTHRCPKPWSVYLCCTWIGEKKRFWIVAHMSVFLAPGL